MKKALFYTGLIFQIINCIGLLILLFDWSFITEEFIAFGCYIIFNIITLLMIAIGVKEE